MGIPTPTVTSVISTTYLFERTLKEIPLTHRFWKRFPSAGIKQETQQQLLYRRCYTAERPAPLQLFLKVGIQGVGARKTFDSNFMRRRSALLRSARTLQGLTMRRALQTVFFLSLG